MASINKHHLLAVALVNLKKRIRRENRKNEKKKIWVKKMNKNRIELGAFSTTFLLAREFDRASFFEQANRDLSIRLSEFCIRPKFAFIYVYPTKFSAKCNSNVIAQYLISFFPSLPLRKFPCEQKFLDARKFT